MKSLSPKSAAFLVSLIVYNYFFWKEDLGINLLLFAILIIVNLFIQYRESFKSANVKITLAGTMLTAITVVVFNSTESKIAHIFSFFLMAAFIHESKMRSVFYAAMHMINGFISVPYSFYMKRKNEVMKFPKIYLILRLIRMSLIPILVSIVFYLLYVWANPIFEKMSVSFWDRIYNAIDYFFTNISFARMFFIILGALILSVIYFRNEVKIFLAKDLSYSEKLNRIKKIQRRKPFAYSSVTKEPLYSPAKPPFKSIALKNQNRRGVILLLIVNLLLLLENFIDIKWLWFGFEIPAGFSLKHYVREGTGYLIVSILFSMALLLYYFRRNQNFYSKNRLLKSLAYVWIIQNMVLCFSIFLRNYHYIDFHGLAYKRIGVDAFLALTVFGLITLMYKIKDLKSVYYLLKINSWAMYFLLITLSFFNWDVNIAKYNLAHWNKGEIDIDFYLKLSEKALPVIYKNLDSVRVQMYVHKQNEVQWVDHLDFDQFVSELNEKRSQFLARQKELTWLSFNFQDENAVAELSKREFANR